MIDVQFLHISDTHLGSRRYNLESREKDVYDTFNNLIEIAIKEHVGVVVHTGDLFDVYNPPTNALKVCVEGLKKLKDKGIPFVSIPGDHDTPKKKGEIYTHRLLSETLELLRFLDGENNKFYEATDGNLRVRFYGVRHIPTVARQRLLEILSSLKPEGNRNVLMLHQGLRSKLPYEGAWQLEEGNLPKGFNYYALGHFHTRFKERLPSGTLAIAGSPDIIREEEIEGYQKYGKGGYLVDVSKDDVVIQDVNVEIRPQEVVTINTNTLDLDVQNLIKKYQGYQRFKPILHIILEGEAVNTRSLYEKLSALNRVAEFYRIYKDNTKSSKEKKIEVPTGSTVNQIISSFLKSRGYTEEEVSQIIELINNYDSDSVDGILERIGGLK
ncbi:MAG: hypothetical protein ASUL_03249 [Candidatus Aramenus sulfurataquae]|uniref:DNA double-strand break repair protein Mre11 n=1 Tax=Candidatus Aramenus sulfurataquae TaxID=1326980 RepID=W7KXR2_9CREN|nr:MAG: hypothetical protein ASUL_03249 [Candidatus Aramenus sulfurataquae]